MSKRWPPEWYIKHRGFWNILLFITFIILASGFNPLTFVPVLVAADVIYFKLREQLGYHRHMPEETPAIEWIVKCSLEMSPGRKDLFIKELKQRLGLTEETVRTIVNDIPDNQTVQLEKYAGQLLRARIWGSKGGKDSYYYEEDMVGGLPDVLKLWGLRLSKYDPSQQLVELGCAFERMAYGKGWDDPGGMRFIVYIVDADKRGGLILANGADDMPKKENIIFELPIGDFDWLEKYDIVNSDKYIRRFLNARLYSVLYPKDEKPEVVVAWSLKWFDVSGKLFSDESAITEDVVSKSLPAK